MKDFLKPSEMYWQYEVNKMGDNDSLQLLSLHAFGKNHPTEAYMACAKKMVHYCGGIPLALEVLGSSLSGQSVDVWNSRLEKLKVIANDDIHGKLKISYDSLGDFEKFIFLDIACFFTGYDKDYVISILEECGFFPVNGINSLMRRCLVKVGSNNKLSMHDLLRDMGRETVRKEHVVDPGERSRLWHHEDVIDVLTNKTGTRAVEGLVLNMPGLKQYSSSTKVFKKMKMLRLLQLNYIHLAGDYKHISSKLRWLCWREFPLDSIPFDLSLENLVALDIRYSNLNQFFEEGKSLKKLKFLNLSHSHKLTETPDFEGCPNLAKLMLKDCIRLEKVHDTIGLLIHLLFLNFQDCKNLKNLPGSIGGLRTLENLNISGCLKLEEMPESVGLLTHLIFLNLQNCENLKKLPGSIGNLKSLQELNMSGCLKLEELPESTGFLICLISLNLHDCENLKNLPGSIGDLKSLEKLDMSGCTKLEDLPESTGHFTSLLFWDLQDCKNLENFPRNIVGLRSLRELNMSGCSKVKELTEDLGNLKSLVVLNLDGTAINILPETIRNMKNLEILSLSECPLIFSPENCPQIISILPFSLKELDIRYCNILDGIIPHAFRGLSSLKVLKLCGNGFTSFPASIISLPNLGQLHLNSCKGLRSIPQLQSSVNGLYANDCLSLESINLTNFHGESALEVKGWVNLKGIEGFFNLEPLEVDIAGKLLGSNSSFIQESVTNYSVRKIDNLVVANAMCPLQALSERGLYSIFLPGNEIPTWFGDLHKGNIVSFNVPRLDPGSTIIGVVTYATYAWGRYQTDLLTKQKSCYTCPLLTITNKTKLFEWIYDPHITFFSRDVEQDISWLCYWMFDNHKRGTDQYDGGWRFKDELEEGDEVEFSIDLGFGINVKKCGIHLLYQAKDHGSQSDDLAIVSYASSRHHRRFLRSRPRLLTMKSNQEITVDTGTPIMDKEFLQWTKYRDQKSDETVVMNRTI
ncbi:disease resistance protein RPV1 [Hevea brasiliensis]|uniref:disease resistance protein RPV1 n=1 Tax=Hevea brasiliensis TaxID=3981 RepID=UPI0025EDEC92|nr:disease resistance protein RPV1 [Hevea brasiliensis]